MAVSIASPREGVVSSCTPVSCFDVLCTDGACCAMNLPLLLCVIVCVCVYECDGAL
jgi:hypothetical protein